MNKLLKIFIGFALSSFALGAQAEEVGTRNITPSQQAFETIAIPEEGQGELSIDLSVGGADGVFTLGDKLSLSLQTNKDAYVTVVNIGVNGVVTVLYPFGDIKDNLIKANTKTEVSGPGTGLDLVLTPPAGTDVVRAFASTKKIPLLDPALITKKGPVAQVTRTARNITPQIQETITETSGDVHWAMDEVLITSIEKGAHLMAADAGQKVVVSKPFGFEIATDKLVYEIGEPIKVEVRTERDCNLTLLNFGTSGAVKVVFPNRLQSEPLIQAGKTVAIPGHPEELLLASAGPVGVESLVAICTAKGQAQIGEAADVIANLFPKVSDIGTLSAKDLAVLIAPQAQPEFEQAVRAAAAIIIH